MRGYLKELRNCQNKSQQDVAGAIGVTRQYYNMIEAGDRQTDMSLSTMQKLSEVFDVPITKIIEEEKKLKGE